MRVLVVDDHDIVRRGVISLLTFHKFDVCGEAVDGQDAIEKARKLRPDAIVMDISMPNLNGLEATKAIRRLLPEIEIFIVSQHDAPEIQNKALEAGARGYVMKSSVSADLVPALDKIRKSKFASEGRAAIPQVAPNDSASCPAEAVTITEAERASLLLAAIVDSSDDAIVSKGLNGIITSWNKSAERMFGYSAEEVIGKPITLIVPSDRLDEERNIIGSLRRGERVSHFETVRVRKDGSTLDVSLTISPIKDSAGRVIGASKVARDITEQKHAQRALRESEERFRAIIEATPECVKLVSADGTLLHMNLPGLALIGADCAEDVVGRCVYDLIATEDRERFRAFNEKICRGERGSLEFDIIGLRGVRRRMESHGAPLRNADGSIDQLGVTRDVTERRHAERAIRESELTARLLQVQDDERRRIARELHDGVGQLLAAMSMNVSRVDQEKAKLSPAAARCVTENGKLIQQVSKDIRTVSYLLHPPMLDEMGLQSALKWFVEGFNERSNIDTSLEIVADVQRLPRDHELCLFRIAQEGLTNVHRHSGSKTAVVRLSAAKGEIRLEVRDEGRGVDEQTKSKIASGKDAGVGFRGMRERLGHLGGTLTVHSNGKGTTVVAALPYAESATSPAADAMLRNRETADTVPAAD